MHKTLACVAMLLVGSFAACSKEKHQEPSKTPVGYDTQPRGHSTPTKTARTEQPQPGIESEWPTEPGMTPASGTQPGTPGMGPPSGPSPGMEPAAGTATAPELQGGT